MRAAIIENGIVTNIIVVDDITAIRANYQNKTLVAITTPVKIGDTYTGTTFVSTPVIRPRATSYSKYDFRKLFTRDELILLDNFENSAFSAANKALVNSLLHDFAASSEIDITHPDLIAGMEILASINVLTSRRVTAILNTGI